MIRLEFISGKETGVKNTTRAIIIPDVNLAEQFVRDDKAYDKHYWRMRMAFGALDGPDMRESCEHFALQLPQSWLNHGIDKVTISSDEDGKLATWEHCHITQIKRVYYGKAHYFFEVETGYNFVYNHKG